MINIRIAFIRLSSSVELNLSTASTNTLGTELRVGLFKSLLDHGHTIKVYSGIRKQDYKLTKSTSLFPDPSTDWTKKIEYEPLETPREEDLLIIEQGTDNVRFSYNNGKEDISYIKRTFDCINDWEGDLIYYQHGALPFPFRTKDASVDTINNLRNLNKRTELFKNKHWTIWHHFTNWDHYLSLKDNPYQPFLDKLNFHFTLVPYSNIEPYFQVRQNPEWDSLFVGSQWDSRSTKQGFERAKEVQDLYDVPGLNNVIIGKWEHKATKKFKHLQYLGQRGSHGDAYRFWNNAYTCIYTTSPVIKQCGLLPTRLTMANRGGAIVLADDTLHCAPTFTSPEYYVHNKTDVKQKINWIKAMSPAERDEHRELQLGKFPNWKDIDINKILTNI